MAALSNSRFYNNSAALTAFFSENLTIRSFDILNTDFSENSNAAVLLLVNMGNGGLENCTFRDNRDLLYTAPDLSTNLQLTSCLFANNSGTESASSAKV